MNHLGRTGGFGRNSSIHISPVPNLDNLDQEHVIMHLKNDSVLSHPVSPETSQIVRKRFSSHVRIVPIGNILSVVQDMRLPCSIDLA
jgi:hypothetical protein